MIRCVFVNEETKTNLFLAVTVKNSVNMRTLFFLASYVGTVARELS